MSDIKHLTKALSDTDYTPLDAILHTYKILLYVHNSI